MRVFDKSILQKRLPFKMLSKRVLQEYQTRVSYKSAWQECPTRVSSKSVLQKGPFRESYKSVLEEFLARVSGKSILQELVRHCQTRVLFQECQTRVSYKSVFQEHGVVGKWRSKHQGIAGIPSFLRWRWGFARLHVVSTSCCLAFYRQNEDA